MYTDATHAVQSQLREDNLLRSLFDSLTRVPKFSIRFPRAESLDISRGAHLEADCYDINSYEMYMDTILHGLRAPAFQHLVTLRLAVPSTHDIGKLAAGMSEDMKQQLQHLSLEIIDCSGPGGSRHYRFGQEDEYYRETKRHQDDTMTSVYDSKYAPGNFQEKYPNREHQKEL